MIWKKINKKLINLKVQIKAALYVDKEILSRANLNKRIHKVQMQNTLSEKLP
jgi:hypothetical protein